MRTRSGRKSAASFNLEGLETRRLLSAVTLDFNGGAGGVANTGFTGVLATSNGKGLASGKLDLSNGRLTVTSTAGDMVGASNNQDNALDLNLDGSRNFTVQTRLDGLPFSKDYQSGGIFVGTGEDSYLKLVVGYGDRQIIQFAAESAGAFSTLASPNLSFNNIATLDLRLVGDAASHTVTAQYRVNSDSDSAWITVGQIANSTAVTSSSKAGIITTNYGAKASVQVPFESFTASTQDPAGGSITPGSNVDVTKTTGSEMESQVAINPTNPNNIVVVAQNDVNGGASINLSYSTDSGTTWTLVKLGSKQDGYNSAFQRPDARVIFDSFGNLYVVYMVADASHAVHIVALRSVDGGASFTSLGSAAGGSDGVNPDDPWLATGVNAADTSKQSLWISFTDYAANRIRIVGLTSSGLGQSSAWTTAKTVSDTFGAYAGIAVGPTGAIALAWQSDDSGQGPNELMLDVDPTGTGNGFGVDRHLLTTNVGGFDFIPPQPDRSIDAEVKVAFDTSNTATRGRLYLVYTDELIDESNDTDIFMKYSDNLGASWSTAVRVNDDTTHNSQFLPALAVDPVTGDVAVSWYDSRNSADDTGAQLYTAVSFNHGASFASNIQVSAGMSNQAYANPSSNDLDFGDNGSLAFYSGKLVTAWSDNSNVLGNNPNGTHSKFDALTEVLTVLDS